MKDKASKIEYAEQRLTTLSLELKASFGLLHLGISFASCTLLFYLAGKGAMSTLLIFIF